MKTPDNWQTRLNYSNRAKGFLAGPIFFMLSMAVESAVRGTPQVPPLISNVPYLLKHTALDFASMSVVASWTQFILKTGSLGTATLAFLTTTSTEIMEYVNQEIRHSIDHGYHPADFTAYALGALAWLAFDKTALALHDSGLTLPIYKALRIHHKKFGNIYTL